jgi:uncharacterized membrane protein
MNIESGTSEHEDSGGRPSASRRGFLTKTLGVAAGAAALALGAGMPASAASDDVGVQYVQGNWRFCEKCYGLFYQPHPKEGYECPAGGSHQEQGWNFYLHYGVAAGPNWQADWRYCQGCDQMFWLYHPDANNLHTWQGNNFVLQHDVGETAGRQAHWRYCDKCGSLFYWGFAGNGRCRVGGAHRAQGWDFVLYH